MIPNFVKISTAKAALYLQTRTNLHSYLGYIFFDLGEICDFRKNCCKKGSTLLIGINEITFMLMPLKYVII